MIRNYNIDIFLEEQSNVFDSAALQIIEESGINGISKMVCCEKHFEIEGETSQIGSFIDWCLHGTESHIISNLFIRKCKLRHFSSFKNL